MTPIGRWNSEQTYLNLALTIIGGHPSWNGCIFLCLFVCTYGHMSSRVIRQFIHLVSGSIILSGKSQPTSEWVSAPFSHPIIAEMEKKKKKQKKKRKTQNTSIEEEAFVHPSVSQSVQMDKEHNRKLIQQPPPPPPPSSFFSSSFCFFFSCQNQVWMSSVGKKTEEKRGKKEPFSRQF